MKNISIVDNYEGMLLHSYKQQVVSSNKSPWVTAVGHRRGKILSLRQNTFHFYREERGPGYIVRVPTTKSDLGYKDKIYTSTSLLSQFGGFTQGHLAPDPNEERTAIAKWYGKAASFSTNVAEIYATRKQTVDLVASTTMRLARAAELVVRRKYKAAALELGITYKRPKRGANPASVWLEYNYGWVPLASDIFLALDQPFPAPYRIITARHRFQSTRVNNSCLPSIKNARWQDDLSGHFTVRGKVTVTGAALAAASSFGLTNPVSLGWELLPFSFVIDWFMPVGPYLEQLTALGGCTVTEKSVTRTYTTNGQGSASTNQPASTYANVPFGCHRTYHEKRRSLGFTNNSFPMLKNPISLHHFSLAASLLALNVSKLDKPRRK